MEGVTYMQAGETMLNLFLQSPNSNFCIPVYQRPYSWKKENCEQLLKDLKEVYNNNFASHFFGSIVYVANNFGGGQEFTIIDGQQRLTTISILLIAIRDFIINNKGNYTLSVDMLNECYLTNKYASPERRIKLQLNEIDKNIYKQLIDGVTLSDDCNLVNNYNFFCDNISKLPKSDIEKLYNAILKLDTVAISLNPYMGDDPQLIFESLNSTGYDLEEIDKIRNYVLMRMDVHKQNDFYNKYWKPFESLISREKINKFIRYYLSIKCRVLFNEKKLYGSFKNYQISKAIGMVELVKDMCEYAGYFNAIVYANDKAKKGEGKEYEVIARINKMEINTCIPFLMDLLKAYNEKIISQKDLIKALEIVESYLARREICGLPTNALNKIFVALGQDIIKDVKRDDTTFLDAFIYELKRITGRSRFPSDRDLEDFFVTYDLYNERSNIRKYILERLENRGEKEIISVDEALEKGTLSIEHVMPQTLTDEWKLSLGENWEYVHTKYKDTVGNLTLTFYNSEYQNYSFNEKKELKDKEGKEIGLDSSNLKLNQYFKDKDTWGEKEIVERAKNLLEVAKKVWVCPSTTYTRSQNEAWIEIDDDFDFTSVIVRKISIQDEIVAVNDMTDAYRKIIQYLFDKDSTLIVESNLGCFSTEKSQLDAPFELKKNFYCETHMSSSAKKDVLEKLAELYDLENGEVKFGVNIFDVNNEATWDTVAIGYLAKALIENMLVNNLLTDEEFVQCKEKEYTKKLFSKCDYPLFADSRDSYKKGSTFRYYKDPMKFKGTDIFVVSQWFKEDRDSLIKWYKQHLS